VEEFTTPRMALRVTGVVKKPLRIMLYVHLPNVEGGKHCPCLFAGCAYGIGMVKMFMMPCSVDAGSVLNAEAIVAKAVFLVVIVGHAGKSMDSLQRIK
jgi:hypothetical protein